jgi:hypothetical protein
MSFTLVFKERQVYGNDIQAAVEVLAEVSVANLFKEVAVRGREYSHVDMDGLFSPDALEVLGLKHPQKPDLGGWGDFADFIQENGAPIGLLEAPGFLADGSGESAFFMSEKLAFEQRCREGRALITMKGLSRRGLR